MDTNFDDAFDNNSNENLIEDTNVEATETETPVVTETVEETTDTATEQVTDPAPKQTPHMVPVDVLTATRREEAQKRAELERRIAEYEAQQRQTSRPDPFENPDDYDQYVQQQVQAQVQNALMERDKQVQMEAFQRSHVGAAAKYGEDAVMEALNWAEQRAATDDVWGRQALTQADPVGWMIEQKNRHAQYEEFVQDPEGFKARLLQAQSTTAAANAVAQTANTAAPLSAPRSLASVGNGPASKPNARTEKESFDALFDYKR